MKRKEDIVEISQPNLTEKPAASVVQEKQYKTLLQSIGNTPLVRLEFGTKPTLLAKLEYLNPGGSVKDRTALFMVEEAERTGLLKPGGTIVEASSGNQGIALAMIGAVKGYKVVITVPTRTSKEKVATLRAYGAEVVVSPDSMESHGYHSLAEEICKRTPGAFMPNQYFNPANLRAHYAMTGPEIWQQTNGTITHLVVGMGSCGVVMGAGKYLKEQNPGIKIIGVDAANSALSSKPPKPYKAEGLGVDVLNGLFDRSVVDTIVPITDDDAFETTKSIAKSHGLLVGISSGAVVRTALTVAKDLNETDVMVVILADSGRAYLSKVFGLEM